MRLRIDFRRAGRLLVNGSLAAVLVGGPSAVAQEPASGGATHQPTGAQTPEPKAEDQQHHHHEQQAAPQGRPQVFFPMAEQPEMEMHHHGQIQEVMPQFPKLGNSQRVVSGHIYQLEELERMAEANNPTLTQTREAIEVARGRERQSGMYPNPVVGYIGEEIRGGSFGGGEQGFFLEQSIPLGGKLRLNRKVGAAEVRTREAMAEAQKRRVENDVSVAYYSVLAAQERLAVQRDLVGIAQTTVRIVKQLGNVGQADETEILQAEAEEQRMEISAGIAERMLRREWSMLAAMVGDPSLEVGGVAGSIDAALPELDEKHLLASLLADSPTMTAARADVERAEAALLRAKRETVPDITLRGGLQNSYEQLGESNRSVGLQGVAEVGVHLRLWDRNQGAIASETASLEAARSEVKRVELELRDRFAANVEEQESARLVADKYRVEILPRLERAYKLMSDQYGEMSASFLRVLILQRMLYENEGAYIDALERVWTSSVTLRGFLLEGGLMASGSSEMRRPERRGISDD